MRDEGVRGLFRGFWVTFWRDLPSWAAYFWAYELFKLHGGVTETERSGQSLSNNQILMKMGAGGLAGVISWLVCFPFDIVKTVIQTSEGRPLTMREVVV